MNVSLAFNRSVLLAAALLWTALSAMLPASLAATPDALQILWSRSFSTNPYARIELSLSPDGSELWGDFYSRFYAWKLSDGAQVSHRTNIPASQPDPGFILTSIARTETDLLLAGERFPSGHPRLLRWDGHAPDVLAGWEGTEGRPLAAVVHHPPTGQVVTAGLVVEDSVLRGALRLHDPDSLVPTKRASIPGEPSVVRFSATGEFVLATGDGTTGVQVWRTTPPGGLTNLYPPIEYVMTNWPFVRITAVAVSPRNLVAYGGQHGDLAELTFYDLPGVIFVHRLPGGEVVRALQGHGHPVGPVAFVGEGDVLMSMDGVTVRFWHMGDGRQLLVLAGPAMGYPAQFANGSLLVAPDTTWFAVHGPDKGQVTQYRMPLLLTHSSVVGEQLEVRWVGGSGRYQVQRSPSPDGAWEDTGEILSERIATLPTTPERGFFRVVSVGE